MAEIEEFHNSKYIPPLCKSWNELLKGAKKYYGERLDQKRDGKPLKYIVDLPAKQCKIEYTSIRNILLKWRQWSV